MQQKTIWMNYLIFGISILLILTATQCKKIVEPVKNVTYIYKNESGIDLEMFIRSYSFDPGQERFKIVNKDSVVFVLNTMSGKPFAGESISSEVTDSVGIKFDTNKCLSFTRDGGNGVFRWPEYEEYTNGMEDQSEYSLTFIFDTDWLAKAKDCN